MFNEIASPETGRFAPSPSGEFHVGNLRTALLAWALARGAGGRFVLRLEDLDERCRPEYARAQLADLRALGLEWDGPVLVQSERVGLYAEAFAQLSARGLVYECYCSRRELSELARAPHARPGHYPGVCRELDEAERQAARARLSAAGRSWSYRLKAEVAAWEYRDRFYGAGRGEVDDFVLRRSDGVFSYNFVAVYDDLAQGVTQVCRGRDLLDSSARQNYLRHLLGGADADYAHVPLVLSPRGVRLAKRDGAVTASALLARGWNWGDIIESLTRALLPVPVRSAAEFLARFDPHRLALTDWVFTPPVS